MAKKKNPAQDADTLALLKKANEEVAKALRKVKSAQAVSDVWEWMYNKATESKEYWIHRAARLEYLLTSRGIAIPEDEDEERQDDEPDNSKPLSNFSIN